MPEEAQFYHLLPDRTVQCDLCHHFCRLRQERSGVCSTRLNRGGKLFTLNYGRPATAGADPVEKKPLYHFLPGTRTFSTGTFGCNFTCANCQNHEISQQSGEAVTVPFRSPDSIVEDAIEHNCPSVSYTYNEPTTFAEYALDIMTSARSAGLKNIWISNGYMSDNCLDEVEPLLDATNIDLKSMDDSFYRRICGAFLNPVLKNLKRLSATGIHIEITTLLIPGHSESPDMLKRLAGFIRDELGAETPWHISAFHPEISWKMHDTPQTTPDMLELAYNIGKNAGLLYVYVSGSHQDTLCPGCGKTVIRRRGYNTIRFDSNGRCPDCMKEIVISS